MQNINLQISESDKLRYRLMKDSMTFGELLDRIRLELAKEALRKCQSLAEKSGLSTMTLEEINDEIKAVRHAKDNS